MSSPPTSPIVADQSDQPSDSENMLAVGRTGASRELDTCHVTPTRKQETSEDFEIGANAIMNAAEVTDAFLLDRFTQSPPARDRHVVENASVGEILSIDLNGLSLSEDKQEHVNDGCVNSVNEMAGVELKQAIQSEDCEPETESEAHSNRMKLELVQGGPNPDYYGVASYKLQHVDGGQNPAIIESMANGLLNVQTIDSDDNVINAVQTNDPDNVINAATMASKSSIVQINDSDAVQINDSDNAINAPTMADQDKILQGINVDEWSDLEERNNSSETQATPKTPTKEDGKQSIGPSSSSFTTPTVTRRRLVFGESLTPEQGKARATPEAKQVKRRGGLAESSKKKRQRLPTVVERLFLNANVNDQSPVTSSVKRRRRVNSLPVPGQRPITEMFPNLPHGLQVNLSSDSLVNDAVISSRGMMKRENRNEI